MTTLLRFAAAGILAALFAFTMAQNRTGSGGWGATSAYNNLYSTGMSVEFKGKVIGVERSAPMQGMDVSVAVLVKADNGGTAMVDLGPAWFVDNLPNKVKMKDRVDVRGSKVSVGGRTMILAQRVVAGNQTIYLRGEDGFPMWVAYRGHVTVAANANVDDQGRIDVGGVQVWTGTVRDIITVNNGFGNMPGVVIVVGDNSGNIWNVNAGPHWFLDRQDFFLNLGDGVVVSGLPRLREGRIIATQIQRGNEMIVLRNQNGQPIWLGGR